MPINQPSNQIRLTNVSLVRLRKGKKRFEIACYKNKVLEYRSGAEQDLDNVLQIQSVFLSVSKGQTAPTDELRKAFGKDCNTKDIIQEILLKGEMQVGEKERQAQASRLHNEVIDIVVGKVVDPRSKRVYTAGMIEKALEQLSSQGSQQRQHQNQDVEHRPGPPSNQEEAGPDCHKSDARDMDHKNPADAAPHTLSRKDAHIWTGVVTTKNAKSQALDAIKALIAWQPIPIMRARMHLRVTCPLANIKQLVKSTGNASHAAANDESQGQKATESTKSASMNLKECILKQFEQLESQEVMGEVWEVSGFVEPGAFKILGDLINAETKGRGRIDILDMAVNHEGE